MAHYKRLTFRSSPNSMKAVLFDQPGNPDQLYIGEHPDPEPGPDELLVRVRATALNRADTLQRRGNYPVPEDASPILGLEMAGTVEAMGSNVTGWKQGDRVFGLLNGGGYAELCTIHHEAAMAMPPGLSFEEAAAVPEVFLTAFQALHWIGRLQAGETVLIHAGASGVGTAALQLARVAEAVPYATATAGKHAVCHDAGAEAAIDYKAEDFAARIDELAERGADLIIDFVGAPYLDQNLKALAMDGRLVLLATLGGAQVDALDLRRLFRKRAQLTASTLRSRSQAYKNRLSAAFAAGRLPLFADGTLRPVIDAVVDWGEAADAHRRMEANENAGKIVLRVV